MITKRQKQDLVASTVIKVNTLYNNNTNFKIICDNANIDFDMFRRLYSFTQIKCKADYEKLENFICKLHSIQNFIFLKLCVENNICLDVAQDDICDLTFSQDV